MTICLVLADLTPEDQRKLMIWGCILMGVVILGSLVIMMLRRRLKEPDAGQVDDGGFSLSQLRAMRDRGEITPDEYEQTRSRVIAKVKAAASAPRPRKVGRPSDTGGLADGIDASIIPADDSPDAPPEAPSGDSAHDGHL